MRLRLPLFVATFSLLPLLGGCSSTAKVAKNVYHSIPFVPPPAKEKAKPAEEGEQLVRTDNVVFRMQVTPRRVKLSETRYLNVRIRLENVSRKFVQLSFPTTQRIELLLRSDDGKIATQWSEDRAFAPTPGYVSINPGEHVEYATTLSTRDLQVGRTYTLLGFFPNYDAFRAEAVVVPEP